MKLHPRTVEPIVSAPAEVAAGAEPAQTTQEPSAAETAVSASIRQKTIHRQSFLCLDRCRIARTFCGARNRHPGRNRPIPRSRGTLPRFWFCGNGDRSRKRKPPSKNCTAARPVADKLLSGWPNPRKADPQAPVVGYGTSLRHGSAFRTWKHDNHPETGIPSTQTLFTRSIATPALKAVRHEAHRAAAPRSRVSPITVAWISPTKAVMKFSLAGHRINRHQTYRLALPPVPESKPAPTWKIPETSKTTVDHAARTAAVAEPLSSRRDVRCTSPHFLTLPA